MTYYLGTIHKESNPSEPQSNTKNLAMDTAYRVDPFAAP